VLHANTHKVFVYGTLRLGHSNHYLLKGSKFIKTLHTGPGFTKIIDTLPYLVEDKNGTGCSGELYEVSSLTFQLLDRLEGNPDWYERKIINLFDGDKEYAAWVYLMPVERL
jgi:gamma-glutamylcyclotransferase (GGCT)/AIG2-like uncharacterized protein YtfP